MKSRWTDKILAVLKKEALTEFRGRHGLFTAALFSLLTVVAMVFASFSEKVTPATVAAMLTAALVFSSVVTVPRTLLSEDEQGTFSLLMLLVEPGTAFIGKCLGNCVQMLIGGGMLTLVYFGMTATVVKVPIFFSLALVLLSLSLAVGVSFCTALVLGSSNRWLLAGVVSLPLLVPVVFLGVVALRKGLDGSYPLLGTQSLIALGGYVVTLFAAGPSLVAAVWRSDR